MSLDFFNPSEGGESYDPAAFERFKEKIKKNAAFVAALRKGEQKQKQKEERLAKILLKFIQSNQKSGVVMLAAKLIEENIPASFVLSIIILGNAEILEEMRKEAEVSLPKLTSPGSQLSPPEIIPVKTDFSLIAGFSDASLPLKIKMEIDGWGAGMIEAGSSVPFRVLETATDSEGEVKKCVINCAANVLEDFVKSNGIRDLGYDTFFSFCEFLMKGIMKRLKQQIENQKELN